MARGAACARAPRGMSDIALPQPRLGGSGGSAGGGNAFSPIKSARSDRFCALIARSPLIASGRAFSPKRATAASRRSGVLVTSMLS